MSEPTPAPWPHRAANGVREFGRGLRAGLAAALRMFLALVGLAALVAAVTAVTAAAGFVVLVVAAVLGVLAVVGVIAVAVDVIRGRGVG